MTQPLVSVIVLNFMSECAAVERCIDAIRASDYPAKEIIIVDNASTNGSLPFLQNKYAEALFVCNDRNLGFAGGNNRGIAAARGEYVLLVNDDAVIDRKLIGELVAAAESDRRIGMCAPKIIMEGTRQLDSAGMSIFMDGMARQRGHLEGCDRYDKREEVLIPSACVALYRREMLDEIGLFCEDFFAYCEDVDLGLRGRWAGWLAVYVPAARAVHGYSRSFGGYSPRKAYLVERNHLWVVFRNFPLRLLLLHGWYTACRLFWQCFALFRREGTVAELHKGTSLSSMILLFVSAWYDGCKRYWQCRRFYRDFRTKRRISGRDVAVLIRNYQISAKELTWKK